MKMVLVDVRQRVAFNIINYVCVQTQLTKYLINIINVWGIIEVVRDQYVWDDFSAGVLYLMSYDNFQCH